MAPCVDTLRAGSAGRGAQGSCACGVGTRSSGRTFLSSPRETRGSRGLGFREGRHPAHRMPPGSWESMTAACLSVDRGFWAGPAGPGTGASGQWSESCDPSREEPAQPCVVVPAGSPPARSPPALSVCQASQSLPLLILSREARGPLWHPNSHVAHSVARPLGLARAEGRQGAGPPPGSPGGGGEGSG